MHHTSKAETVLSKCNTATHFEFSQQLDTEFLTNTYKDNLEFGEKMFNIFVRTNPIDMSELDLAIGRTDYEVIRGIAHKIKNNYTWVGLKELSAIMYKIETAAKAKSPELIGLYQSLKTKQEEKVSVVIDEHNRMKEFLGDQK